MPDITKPRELRFPTAGVARGRGYQEEALKYPGPYSSPWSVNITPEDPASLRYRGGTRPGLTKYYEGAVTGDAHSVATLVTPAGTVVGVLSDGLIGTWGSTVSYLTCYLLTESGDAILTEAGDEIVASAADAPETAYLLAADQRLYGITTSGVTVFDLTTGEVKLLTASAGTVPTGCTFGAIYFGRLFLAGANNMIYVSRRGDFTDWDYSAPITDTAAPYVFQLSQSNQVGRTPTAFIPVDDETMIAASATDLWAITDDIREGGRMRRINPRVGCAGSRAWCRMGDSILFLANDGLWEVGASGRGLKLLSGNIPGEIRSSSYTGCTLLMGFDQGMMGVYIFMSPIDGSSGVHWFFDLKSDSFWPQVLAEGMDPFGLCEVGDKLLLACNDGYLREIGGTDDDGTNIQSHLTFGPLRLSDGRTYGRLLSLQGTTAAGSADVTWNVVIGDTAEAAAENAKAAIEASLAGSSYASYVEASGTLVAGRNNIDFPRVRAPWAVIWIRGTDAWAYESLLIETLVAGRWK